MKEIEIILNSSEITAGTRGASMGPFAVIAAARNKKSLFFGKYPLKKVATMNHMLDTEIKFPYAKRIEGLVQVYQNVCADVEKTIADGKFPMILAGDHGSAGGTIAGIKAAYPSKRLGVIWIDAHGDIHTPYTTPSGNMHGMPLATALGEDNLQCKSNHPTAYVLELWEQLKNIGAPAPKLKPEDLVYIGVRDTEKEEDAIIERYGITNHTVEAIRSMGKEVVLKLTLTQLERCDIIYVSFDVDSMDPVLTSQGTGTPSPNGISPEEAKYFLTELGKNEKLVCMEFVEVNPCLDEKSNTMAEITFELFEAAAKAIEE